MPGASQALPNHGGMVGSAVKRRRSSTASAAIALDVGGLASLGEVLPRERVNAKGFLMHIPGEPRTITLRAGSVENLTPQEKAGD